MKVGDLVEFHTKAWVFLAACERYVNPGIILTLEHLGNWSEVWWSDGKITKEHHSYLRPACGGTDEDR
jgi:hypothetical protein